MKHYLTDRIEYNGVTVTNIFKRFRFLDQYSKTSKCYIDYIVQDGETPESVSYSFYRTTDWWWVICILNDVYNPFYDWPLSQMEMESYAKKLVPDWETNSADYSAKMEELTDLNYKKAQIKLLKPQYLDEVIKEIKGFNT